ncbi:hypothetical protein M8C21_002682 [Ambrosia artemisiifolia]|uniref:Protein kinase domain-containing protein n=1 Tax=Ambrosia artemisiifolia TaxID=4212 RepID=A0AAD5G2H7_AMBAR|nr:hypothetical protein M8C21_002682 [Ambrosia artemisiifolia]
MSITGDGLDHLRIPYDKIQFGEKLESQGYGTVYKGKFDDQLVALKKLNITNIATIKPKLLAEILTISRFQKHPNLVALLGVCDEKSNKIILVYEYVAGGNLGGTRLERLNTIQRLELCLGAARGLCYLHTGLDDATIVHGNITFSKILLNLDTNSSKLEAKVSSFGLSKIMPGKSDAEYSNGVAQERTKESDVCSFGMLLLELLCGSRNVPDTDEACEIYHVSELVPKKMKQNKLRQTVDIHIRHKIEMQALETYAEIACQCVMENPEDRPDMVKVVEKLEKALILQENPKDRPDMVKVVEEREMALILKENPKDRPDMGKVVEEREMALILKENPKDRPGMVKVVGELEKALILQDSNNNDQVITKESNEEENESKSPTESVYNEMSTTHTNTTEDQTMDAFDSSNKLMIIKEIKEDDKSMDVTSNNEKNIVEATNTGGKATDVQIFGSCGIGQPEVVVGEDDHEGDDNGETRSSDITKEEPKRNEETTDGGKVSDKIIASSNGNSLSEVPVGEDDDDQEGDDIGETMSSTITKEVQNSAVSGSNGKASNSAIQIQKSESTRSNSTCSESSNGDDTAPLAFLLPKSHGNVEKTSRCSDNYWYCFCSWLQFISDRVVFYGGLFWNKLVNCLANEIKEKSSTSYIHDRFLSTKLLFVRFCV